MGAYKSQRHNDRNFIIRQWIRFTLLLFIPPLLDYVLPTADLVFNSYWFYAIGISLGKLIDICREDRINEIEIDTNERHIIVKYYDVMEGQVKKTLPFKSTEVDVKTNNFKWIFEPITIYFLDKGWEILNVSQSKDGFSIETLTGLKTQLELLTVPKDVVSP